PAAQHRADDLVGPCRVAHLDAHPVAGPGAVDQHAGMDGRWHIVGPGHGAHGDLLPIPDAVAMRAIHQAMATRVKAALADFMTGPSRRWAGKQRRGRWRSQMRAWRIW